MNFFGLNFEAIRRAPFLFLGGVLFVTLILTLAVLGFQLYYMNHLSQGTAEAVGARWASRSPDRQKFASHFIDFCVKGDALQDTVAAYIAPVSYSLVSPPPCLQFLASSPVFRGSLTEGEALSIWRDMQEAAARLPAPLRWLTPEDTEEPLRFRFF